MLGRQRPFSPSVPAEAGCLFTVAAGVHVSITGESLHCFLVGWCTNKSYVIATSDLWLFIHASNLLPSTPHPHSPTKLVHGPSCTAHSCGCSPWPPCTWRVSRHEASATPWCAHSLGGPYRHGATPGHQAEVSWKNQLFESTPPLVSLPTMEYPLL